MRARGDASIPASWKLLALSGQHTRGPLAYSFRRLAKIPLSTKENRPARRRLVLYYFATVRVGVTVSLFLKPAQGHSVVDQSRRLKCKARHRDRRS